jgi:hypothetical protein
MKDSAQRETEEVVDDSSAFRQFAKVMRALIAVPKSEVHEKLMHKKANQRVARNNKPLK